MRGQLLGAALVFHSFLVFASTVFHSDNSSDTPDLFLINHLGARSAFAAYQYINFGNFGFVKIHNEDPKRSPKNSRIHTHNVAFETPFRSAGPTRSFEESY